MSSLYLPRQIDLGSNSLQQLGKIVVENGANRLFVIIDAFLASEPLSYDEKIREIVQRENIDVTFFSNYKGEPTTDHLKAALDSLNESNADFVVAMGGGSAIDIAKAVSLFALNPFMKWEEITKQKGLNRLPLVAIPTTAGTGSESTKVMVITNSKTNIKMNPSHKNLIPDVSILDPELTKSLPKHFTAYTGLDALTHAMEAYVSSLASDMTDVYALNAMRIIGKALPKVYENGNDIESRKDMLLASCYAGTAFTNSSTNLAHAAGRSLGARFHIPHGLSVALLLPFVMRFGSDVNVERYATVALCLGEEPSENAQYLAEKSVEIVEKFNDQFNIWKDGLSLIDLKDFEKNVSILVEDAMSGNGIDTNRKVPSRNDVAEVYQSLLKKLKMVEQLQS